VENQTDFISPLASRPTVRISVNRLIWLMVNVSC